MEQQSLKDTTTKPAADATQGPTTPEQKSPPKPNLGTYTATADDSLTQIAYYHHMRYRCVDANMIASHI